MPCTNPEIVMCTVKSTHTPTVSDYLVTGELPVCFRGALRLCKEVKSGDHRTAEGELFYIAVVLAGPLQRNL